MTLSPRRAVASPPLKGECVAPGDKSLSHRALILAARVEGRSEISGLLEGEDVLRTAAALRALGVGVERERGLWRVEGAKWRAPAASLYFGNSGTGARLMMGAVAGAGVAATFDGDASLRRRPMARIVEPLALMGAATRSRDGLLPVAIDAPAGLAAIDYALPKPSAQIKSAVLLAALGAKGTVVIREGAASRDHTERMLPAFGATIETAADGDARVIRFEGGQRLLAARLEIAGDPSSAAFLVVAALTVPGSDILVRNVGVNPLRIGLIETLNEMGGDIDVIGKRMVCGEPVADLRIRHASLKRVAVPATRAPSMIDEYPILAVAASFASGTSRFDGLSELRVKESDRLAAIVEGLKANGVSCRAGPDWLEIDGRGGVAGGAKVATHMDHRIAMSFFVMGLGSKAGVEIDDDAMIATSYPEFFDTLARLGAAV